MPSVQPRKEYLSMNTCAQQWLYPGFMLSISFLPTPRIVKWMPLYRQMQWKNFVSWLEKGRRKRAAEVPFGCSRKTVGSSWEAIYSAVFFPVLLVGLPVSMLKRCWHEEWSASRPSTHFVMPLWWRTVAECFHTSAVVKLGAKALSRLALQQAPALLLSKNHRMAGD